MSFSASVTCVWPSACFLVQPAPATNSSSASGRMVCASAAGSRTPVTVVRLQASGSSTATVSTRGRSGCALPGRLAAGIDAG